MSLNEPTSILSALVPPDAYQASRCNLFPSQNALDWYSRQHRQRLIDGGALLKHQNRWFIHPEKFDACVCTLGAENAKKHVA